MKTILLSFIILATLLPRAGFAKNYIVLFKQAEINISSLEHEAFQNLLETSNKKSVGQLQEWLGARNARASVVDLWLVRGAALSLEDANAAKLAQEPWVEGLHEDKLRRLISPMEGAQVGNSLQELGVNGQEDMWGLKRIGLPKIRHDFPQLNGAGVRVGILDTGIQSKHPELASVEVTFKDFINGITDPYDDNGHGTHVAGTIAGAQVGIAPKASLVVAKVFGGDGSAMDSDLLRAMQWMFDPDGKPATPDYPRVVSNSWGGDLGTTIVQNLSTFRPYHQAILAWIHGGIVPVFAAGNSGNIPNGFPGGLPEPLAVGALAPNDSIAYFSSRGPNVWRTGESVLTVLKPDITAPGMAIVSSIPGNRYAAFAGTSMATPHVSGAIALALQANKKLRFPDVKRLLLESSQRKLDIHFGYGVLDAFNLVRLASK